MCFGIVVVGCGAPVGRHLEVLVGGQVQAVNGSGRRQQEQFAWYTMKLGNVDVLVVGWNGRERKAGLV